MMRKIFGLLSLLLTIITVNAQDSSSPRTINATEFPVALYSGIPNVEIPLGEVNTANANFSLPLTLSYNLYASTNRDFSTNDIGDAWSLDLKPTITVNPKKINVGMGFAGYYDEEQYSMYLREDTDSKGFSGYKFDCFGLQGSFVIVKEGDNFYAKVTNSNDYVEVEVDYTTTGDKFRLVSFTMRNKTGFEFLFIPTETESKVDSYYGNNVYLIKKVFSLSLIKDKTGTVLASYIYDGSLPAAPQPHSDYTIELDEILVPTQGKIVFNQYDIEIKDRTNALNKKIVFTYEGGGINKKLLNKIKVYGTGTDDYEEYNLTYRNSLTSSINSAKMFYGFPHTACSRADFDEDHIHFDHGALAKIVYPGGGTVFYEYEPNTTGTVLSPADTESGWYQHYYKSIVKNNANNFTFEQIPLTYNSTYGGYIINPQSYTDGIDDILQEIYIEYSADQVQIAPGGLIDENGNISPGKFATPKLGVGAYLSNPNTIPNYINVDQNISYNCQAIYTFIDDNHKIFLKIQPEFIDAYNYIRVYYLKPKPDNELEFFGYSPGPRIKRIKSFDREVGSINSTTYVASETLYKYNLFGFENSSSGYGLHSYPLYYDHLQYTIEKHVLYRNVSVVTPGKGVVEYTFGDLDDEDILDGIPENKESFPKYVVKQQKKNQAGQTLETSIIDRNYANNSNETSADNQTHPVVSYEKVTSDVYIPGSATKKLSTLTETSFDTITRHMVHRKITDVNLAQTFEEEHQYQKLGNAYYRTFVKKYKNGTMINQSKAEYSPLNSGTLSNVYALEKSSVAKGTRPFETEKEITKRDNKGNILEYKTKEDTYVSQIWGYDDTKLVAELKNVRYNEISSTTITNIKGRSGSIPLFGAPSLDTSYSALRTAHPQAFITTYTYIPMVGLKTTTDANGRKETYQYDNFNRLYRVLNHEGNIIKEYNYNIKN